MKLFETMPKEFLPCNCSNLMLSLGILQIVGALVDIPILVSSFILTFQVIETDFLVLRYMNRAGRTSQKLRG